MSGSLRHRHTQTRCTDQQRVDSRLRQAVIVPYCCAEALLGSTGTRCVEADTELGNAHVLVGGGAVALEKRAQARASRIIAHAAHSCARAAHGGIGVDGAHALDCHRRAIQQRDELRKDRISSVVGGRKQETQLRRDGRAIIPPPHKVFGAAEEALDMLIDVPVSCDRMLHEALRQCVCRPVLCVEAHCHEERRSAAATSACSRWRLHALPARADAPAKTG